MNKIHWIITVTFLFIVLISCLTKSEYTANSPILVESNNQNGPNKLCQIESADSLSNVFVVKLKPGLDSVKATIDDSTIFVATEGQLLLYWNETHSACIADGRFGYIPSDQLMRVDTPCFKFNFSKQNIKYEKDYELYQTAQRAGYDLNVLINRILNKEDKALLQFFRLRDLVDGASAEEYPVIFWVLINFWSDKELSSFISNLNHSEKKTFCELLLESSYCSPFEYYSIHYPLTMEQINMAQ